jgi:hypothetical protein
MNGLHGKRWEPPPGARVNLLYLLFTFHLLHSLVRGARTPRPAHSALPRAEGFLIVISSSLLTEGRRLVPFVFLGPHIP